jgi:hypothetical protein
MGEDDLETNMVHVRNYLDSSTNEVVSYSSFLLPADSWKDFNTLDWVLSIKNNQHQGED